MVFYSLLFVALVVTAKQMSVVAGEPYYGVSLGKIPTLMHEVTGTMYAVDATTLFIKGFTFDGEAPNTNFFAGNKTPEPSNTGFIIPDETGTAHGLGPYRNKNIILNIPVTTKGQRSLNDIAWVSVWCQKFTIDFGHVKIPKNVTWPAPVKGGTLVSAKPSVGATEVTLKDTATITVRDFTYDGSLEDVIFVVGNSKDNIIQVWDEKGSKDYLKKYTKKDLSLTLPKEVVDQVIQYFGVWSASKGMVAFVEFPSYSLLPPSLKLLI